MIRDDESLVSIVMPAYNSEKYIKSSIESVIQQTYSNWELLIVDDKSIDSTTKIVEDFIDSDSRISLEVLNVNSGAAIARNQAIKKAKGKYLAFLDSDDIWNKEKLSKQINFMKEFNYSFSCTSYGLINGQNESIGNITRAHKSLDYDGILKHCPGNSTVVYNVESIGKVYVPNIKKRNDFLMWLNVIKLTERLYGLDENLTKYRVSEGSLSSNKISLVRYQWRVYRKFEHINIVKSIYLLVHKIVTVLFFKRIKCRI